MINNREPISMSEAIEYIDKEDEGGKETVGFIRKFVKTDSKDAVALREKLKELDLMKLKEEDISKVIDLLPETSEELNKIFVDVGLDEDETKNILERVKEIK